MITAVNTYVVIELLELVITIPVLMAILFLLFRFLLLAIVLVISVLFPKKRRKKTYYNQLEEDLDEEDLDEEGAGLYKDLFSVKE